jgi:hypothetical protein
MNRALVPAALLVLLAAGCSDDGGDDGSIASRGQWCSVAAEVDDAFAVADAGAMGFEEQQAAYADIVASIERLEHGLAHVDDDARDDVAGALAGAKAIARAFADAADLEGAEAALEPVFAEYEEPVDAAAWISDNCDVDIAG